MIDPIDRRRFLARSAAAAVALTGGPLAMTRAADDRAADARAEELLRAMSLDEKIGQMTQADMNALRDKSDVAKFALGSVLSGGDSDPPDITPAGWARAHDEFQRFALQT